MVPRLCPRALFLSYINDLENDIKSQINFFADDTSLFSIVHDADLTADGLNHDLNIISEWAFNWKTSFNPDLNKQLLKLYSLTKPENKISPKSISTTWK